MFRHSLVFDLSTLKRQSEKPMNEELISVLDLSRELGRRKQTVFKVLKRLGIETRKQRSSKAPRQLIAYVTVEESRRVEDEMRATAPPVLEPQAEALPEEQGVFYLLLLEPDNDPGRFKVGFAESLPERVRSLKCSAPFLRVVMSWPCKKLWDRTAIDCVTAGCERLHTEVFRTTDIEQVTRRCEGFFGLMPNLRPSGAAAPTRKTSGIESHPPSLA